jgi:repressor LexA
MEYLRNIIGEGFKVGKVQERRDRVYDYIASRIDEGSPPSVREICADLDIKSTSTVHSDLKALCERGLIQMTEGLNRAIKLPGRSCVAVPLVKDAAPDMQSATPENIEQYIPFDPAFRGRDLFALRVGDDGMKGDCILEGDIVVGEKGINAGSGQMVAALIGGEAAVRTYYFDNSHHRLEAKNGAFEPVILDNAEILGKVVGVLRYIDHS